jgi:hypothetical protein
MRYTGTLGSVTLALPLTVTWGSLLASVKWKLSVAHVQTYVYRSCTLLLAKVAGRQELPGA